MPVRTPTMKQWMRLVERLLARENIPISANLEDIVRIAEKKGIPASEAIPSSMRPTIAELLGREIPEPPIREYGKFLDKEQSLASGLAPGMGLRKLKATILPYEEAKEIVTKDPERYIPFGTGKVTRVAFEQPPGSFGEVAPGTGITMEKMIFRKLPTASELQTRLKKLGGATTPTKEKPGTNLLSYMAEADDMWKLVVKPSTGGMAFWKNLYAGSRIKKHFDNAKEYFTSMYLKWRLKEPRFEQKFPREAKYFEVAFKGLPESQREGLK